LCPNGHALAAPESRAGRPGHCPKCQTGFVVPTLEEYLAATGDEEGSEEESVVDGRIVTPAGADKAPSQAKPAASHEPATAEAATSPWKDGPAGTPTGASTGSDDDLLVPDFQPVGHQPVGQPAQVSPPEAKADKTSPDKTAPGPGKDPQPADSTAKAKTPTVSPPADVPLPNPPGEDSKEAELIVFLCPNGHKLHGPATLKGKPGQCPHCGSKFRVPDDEENDEDIAVVDAQASGGLHAKPAQPRTPQGVSDDTFRKDEEIPVLEAVPAWQVPPPAVDGGYRIQDLFAWMWEEKPEEAKIELQFADGKTFEPVGFAAQLSRQNVAVFETKDGDKSVITTLRWDDVRRIIVNGVDDLPEQLFR